ncbi:MAG TPA: universal stress protein [Candidatus Binatia bacterium]|nr:universal stress protein [Candidatus Binatia bacterium]HKB42297.1 universal stress protein [Gemmataceae bacterium]
MFPIRTILHPTDFSPQSEQAYRAARILARDCNARLIVVHVLTPPPLRTAREKERGPEASDTQLRDLRTKLRGLSHTYKILQGRPAAEIVAAAKNIGADLIVMGTHGRSGLTRALLGSVAESVLRKAPCPVLTVKHSAGPAAQTPAANKA